MATPLKLMKSEENDLELNVTMMTKDAYHMRNLAPAPLVQQSSP
jgi:hypothetical protein